MRGGGGGEGQVREKGSLEGRAHQIEGLISQKGSLERSSLKRRAHQIEGLIREKGSIERKAYRERGLYMRGLMTEGVLERGAYWRKSFSELGDY